jgi:hypothetical protein
MIIVKADMPVRYEAETMPDAVIIFEALERQGCTNIRVEGDEE